MRLSTVAVSCVLLAFGLAFPEQVATRLDQPGTVAPVPAPQCVGNPSPACCGADCSCCDACVCDEPKSTQAEDLSSHVGQIVERKTRPGLWEVTDAWRDESGELMYMYRQVQSAASGNCPGGVCPQPMQTGFYDGTSQWTYPGDIAGHLQGSNHNISQGQLAGMSKDEMEALHDSLHNGTRSAPVQVQSNCPGGVCPQPSVRRRGLFRWR